VAARRRQHQGISIKDQGPQLSLHGEALLTARRPGLQPLIDHLRVMAWGRDDIRTECARVIAGSWFADSARRGEDLIAAGLLMLAGGADLDELDKCGCVSVGRGSVDQQFHTATSHRADISRLVKISLAACATEV
jgi:hypothetical protein